MTVTITSLLGNHQRLDGGAMFGNAPRALWSRWLTPDDDHRVRLACRCMLVRDGDRTILVETGIGTFFPPKLKARFGVAPEEDVLVEQLDAHGLTPDDIDVVVLSHLHFDHAGGLLSPYAEGKPPRLRFGRATFVVGEDAWQRAVAPHPRDRASFIDGLTDLLQGSGRLERVTGDTSKTLGPQWRLHWSDGHTPGLMMVEVSTRVGPVVFAGDLIPGMPWMHTAITMGYDRYPELLVDEKTRLLSDLEARNGHIFFTHDPETAIATVARDARGRFYGADPRADVDGWPG